MHVWLQDFNYYSDNCQRKTVMKLESDNVFHVYYEDEGENAREICRSHCDDANHSGKHKWWIYNKESAPTETTWTTQAWHSYLGLEGVWIQ